MQKIISRSKLSENSLAMTTTIMKNLNSNGITEYFDNLLLVMTP